MSHTRTMTLHEHNCDHESDPLICIPDHLQHNDQDIEKDTSSVKVEYACITDRSHKQIRRYRSMLITISLMTMLLPMYKFYHGADPDPLTSITYGLVSRGRYISYTGYGRLSNNIISLSNAVYYAQISGRKILAFPPTNSFDGTKPDFSLSWLQILDLQQINSYLSPNQCHIQGLGTDPVVDDYIVKGLNTNLSCGESSEDAPWRLRSPSSWSTGCWILPWSHTPIISSNVSHPLKLLRSSHDELGSGRFPGASQCDRQSLSELEVIDATNLTSAILERDRDELVLVNGETMYFAVDHAPVYLSYNSNIKHLARNQASVLESPSLCMHVRREDLIRLSIDSFVVAADDLYRTGAIKSVFVITNGDLGDIDYMRQKIPALKQIGCDPARTEACQWSTVMRAAIEQQLCAEADYFIGSPLSTFSLRVMTIRAHETDFPSNSSWILHETDKSGGHDIDSLNHYDRPGYVNARKVVAFTLYGDRPMDLVGAVFNARSIPLYYLSWKALFMMDNTVPASSIEEIRAAGGEVHVLPAEFATWGEGRRILRYLALNDTSIDYVMFRDTDSRVSAREISSVHSWLRTNKSYHIMRDHPAHTFTMLGGMWGVYAPTLRKQIGNDVASSIINHMQPKLSNNAKFDDQTWLSEQIFPHIRNDVIDHDSFLCGQYSPYSAPFPLPRDYYADYVGHILDPSMTELSQSFITALWPEYRLNGDANFHKEVPERCRIQPEYIYG